MATGFEQASDADTDGKKTEAKAEKAEKAKPAKIAAPVVNPWKIPAGAKKPAAAKPVEVKPAGVPAQLVAAEKQQQQQPVVGSWPTIGDEDLKVPKPRKTSTSAKGKDGAPASPRRQSGKKEKWVPFPEEIPVSLRRNNTEFAAGADGRGRGGGRGAGRGAITGSWRGGSGEFRGRGGGRRGGRGGRAFGARNSTFGKPKFLVHFIC